MVSALLLVTLGAPWAGAATGPAAPAAVAACPAVRAAPNRSRPQVSLDLTLGAHHGQVSGTEQVVFRPDRPIDRLVLRLTANSTYLVRMGTRVHVSAASASPAGGRFGFARAGASAATQGGLLVIPLTRTVAAGTVVRASVRFEVTLGARTGDRIGRSNGFAWFGSAQPLLAWQRGYGWHTEPMISFPAETATSEAADTTIRLSAPAADTVIGTGRPAVTSSGGGRRVWTAHPGLARDISLAAGPFRVVDRTVGRAALRVGAPTVAAARAIADRTARAMTVLANRFGAFPFGSLSMARLPGSGFGGIEYPGAVQLFDADEPTVTHETAHQWFYGMVGDSQSRDPWLDEAFAEYAQRLVDGTPEPRGDLTAAGAVGRSVQSYGTDVNGYYFVTYAKGAAALEAARRAAGATAFDAALRCYVRANAWRIATPADLARSLARVPAAITALRRAGALP
ncbi:MAG: M1 family aminopeptidase [Jatrophihabitans sp.]|uniref:M1 family aminopeptidase n=1 Tax=Jatrophihabitans sp. TaxID=1932789 RepID=UPI003F808B2C